MDIRPYRPPDCPEMAQLFYNTVHIINARTIRPASWMPGPPAQWTCRPGTALSVPTALW